MGTTLLIIDALIIGGSITIAMKSKLMTSAFSALINALFNRNPKNEAWPLYAKQPLTSPEQVLYFRLVNALPDHIVLAQVQLSRMLGVKKGHNAQSWLNRINRMSADFVVCDKDSSIVAVIELDDATHNRSSRQLADNKKDEALLAAGIPVVRWKVNQMPETNVIQSTILTGNSVIS